MLIQPKHSSPAAAAEATEAKPIKRAKPPATVELRGLKLCPNENYLYAVLDGVKVTVRAGRQWAHRLTGKTFKATPEIRVDGETIYVYQP
jgi:hypothetical protein